MTRTISLGIGLAVCALLAAPIHALTIVEPFATETPDATDGSYPDFSLNVGTASVSGGVLQLGIGNFLQRFTRPGFDGSLMISGQIQSESFGDWQVGMEFGNRGFTFHPGFPTSAFQIIDLTTENSLLGSLDMGFTPSATAFHTMQLVWDDDQGQLTIRVTDGDGIASPFQLAWAPDPGFDPTGRMGFIYWNGGGDGGIASFDNLTVVPEPSAALLVVSGLTLVVARRARDWFD